MWKIPFSVSFGRWLALACGLVLWALQPAPAPAGGGMGGMGGGGACTLGITWNAGYPLQFGTLTAPSAGTVVVGTGADSASTTGGVIHMGGTVTRARFTVTCSNNMGETGTNYAVTLPPSTTLSNGSTTMTVDNFQGDPVSGYISDGGSFTLYVGATLNAGTNQEAGGYSGTFDVTVDYP